MISISMCLTVSRAAWVTTTRDDSPHCIVPRAAWVTTTRDDSPHCIVPRAVWVTATRDDLLPIWVEHHAVDRGAQGLTSLVHEDHAAAAG